ncbi:hypothetical protein LX36DRAFT_655214 [Colletotrichum falcatum]|nr:hypothetical protein LX36DRAFT_655214 [Colletotrichum falcatum]
MCGVLPCLWETSIPRQASEQTSRESEQGSRMTKTPSAGVQRASKRPGREQEEEQGHGNASRMASD